MATEQVVETVAEGLEVAAEHFEDAAVATRALNAKTLGYFFGGLGIGVAVGFFIGYRLNRAKIRAEAFKDSEEEVEKIREMYRDSARVVRDRDVKPNLEEVIEERQYSVTEREEDHGERPTEPPVPVTPPRIVIREDVGSREPTIKLDTGKSKNLHWDFEEEIATRSEERPYIIHQDEYQANEKGYSQEVLTWYAGDNVLTDDDEDPILNADELIDLNHMSRFGHGTDDFNVLFIRNERIEKEFEIGRISGSYAEEVQGLTNDDEPH